MSLSHREAVEILAINRRKFRFAAKKKAPPRGGAVPQVANKATGEAIYIFFLCFLMLIFGGV
jgi:hypothetical protein